jgi:hypothetical protein
LIGARPSNIHILLTIAVGVLALGIRLWGLESQSLTMDEVAELNLVRQSVPDIIRSQDGFPPLYLLLLKGWLAIVGPGSARLLSVLCGMLLIPAVWHIGRMVGGSTAAWAAAFLTAISPIHVWYAQEARANALFYLFAVLSLWLFLRAMRGIRGRDWAWYGLSAIAGLYTHYYFTLLIAGLLATVPLLPDARRQVGTLASVHALMALAALPWIWLLLPDLDLQSGYAAPHVPLDLKSLGYTLVTFLFGFSVGPSLRDLHVSQSGDTLREALPWGIAAATVCLLLVPPLWRSPGSRRWMLALGLTIVLPIAACGIAAAVFNLGFRVRYVAWGASLLLVLLSAAIVHGRRSAGTVVATVILIGLSVLSLMNRQWNGRYSNEDARGAATYVATSVPRSSPVFVTSGYMAEVVSHYLGRDWQLRALPTLPPAGPPTPGLEVIRADVPPGARFWLLYSRPWDGDPGGRLRDELRTQAELRLIADWPGMELYEGRGW